MLEAASAREGILGLQLDLVAVGVVVRHGVLGQVRVRRLARQLHAHGELGVVALEHAARLQAAVGDRDARLRVLVVELEAVRGAALVHDRDLHLVLRADLLQGLHREGGQDAGRERVLDPRERLGAVVPEDGQRRLHAVHLNLDVVAARRGAEGRRERLDAVRVRARDVDVAQLLEVVGDAELAGAAVGGVGELRGRAREAELRGRAARVARGLPIRAALVALARVVADLVVPLDARVAHALLLRHTAGARPLLGLGEAAVHGATLRVVAQVAVRRRAVAGAGLERSLQARGGTLHVVAEAVRADVRAHDGRGAVGRAVLDVLAALLEARVRALAAAALAAVAAVTRAAALARRRAEVEAVDALERLRRIGVAAALLGQAALVVAARRLDVAGAVVGRAHALAVRVLTAAAVADPALRAEALLAMRQAEAKAPLLHRLALRHVHGARHADVPALAAARPARLRDALGNRRALADERHVLAALHLQGELRVVGLARTLPVARVRVGVEHHEAMHARAAELLELAEVALVRALVRVVDAR
mmetsp:Transcript_2870/g.10157  ORF Transcript_2870/g.10157 Transcript_2870/m.10157 type:complete len:538 (+) Transcript_2870:2259-3872(+)